MAEYPGGQPELLGSTGDIPLHVAVIMDGNGRWAKARGLSRALGHRAGMSKLHEVVEAASEAGVSVLTVYAFSTENWKRPADEVGGLFSLLVEFFAKEIDELDAKGVRIRIIGDISALPARAVDATAAAVERTKDNKGLTLCIAMNYGGRSELIRAARSIAEDAADGRIKAGDITEDMLSERLYTGGLPDPDLIIRTAGEQRLSNFLLFQCAYSELVFTDTLWPDYGKEEFYASLHQYQMRSRRFGGVK